MEPLPVTIPLLNPNEPDGILAAIHASAGQHVRAGDLLFTLETTKATADVTAEADGYLMGLRFAIGDSVRAGQTFAYLAPSPDWQPPAEQSEISTQKSAIPSNLRITQPALALAQQHNLDLSKLPVGPLITEKSIREWIGGARASLSAQQQAGMPALPFDATAILVYGGGGHGKALIDLLRVLGSYRIAGVVDDGISAGSSVMGAPVLGGSAALANAFGQGVRLAVNAVGGISNIQTRIKVFDQLAAAGFACPTLIHPTAWVEPSATLAAGVQVFPHAYVGSEAQVGYGVIVNTGAIVSHGCTLGDYANLSPGAILAGDVTVGERSLVGMGVTINLGVKVGVGARIGNGATVKGDVPAGGIVRAGTIFPS
jgi:sugar O-acyltransferase (sialic acid O-acetyltransferase NeuD family)